MIRRLISFGEKNILRPEPLDLNELISGMESRIRGVLREGIEFETICRRSLARRMQTPASWNCSSWILWPMLARRCPEAAASIKTTDIEIDRPRILQGAPIAQEPMPCFPCRITAWE